MSATVAPDIQALESERAELAADFLAGDLSVEGRLTEVEAALRTHQFERERADAAAVATARREAARVEAEAAAAKAKAHDRLVKLARSLPRHAALVQSALDELLVAAESYARIGDEMATVARGAGYKHDGIRTVEDVIFYLEWRLAESFPLNFGPLPPHPALRRTLVERAQARSDSLA